MKEKNKINARIVADSISPQGHRITTFVLIYPRMIHAEVMTHRLFSRNAASSRAIPFKTMVKSVEDDPFIPIAWQKDHKGMQGTEYITDQAHIDFKKGQWIIASKKAIECAKDLNSPITIKHSFDDEGKIICEGVTKQLCNRLLEPFLWYTNLVTVTELDNFYELRCPKYESLINDSESKDRQYDVYSYDRSWKDYIKRAKLLFGDNHEIISKMEHADTLHKLSISKSGAEIHIQALAEAMWDAQNESTPNQLQSGEWHIPFGDRIDDFQLQTYLYNLQSSDDNVNFSEIVVEYKLRIKIATARAARLSYMTFDGEIDYKKDIELHDILLKSKHASPFEHCCRVMTDLEYYSFMKGEISVGQEEDGSFYNNEYYPYSNDEWIGFIGANKNNGNRYGWCNNVRGFIQYRYLIEKEYITNK